MAVLFYPGTLPDRDFRDDKLYPGIMKVPAKVQRHIRRMQGGHACYPGVLFTPS